MFKNLRNAMVLAALCLSVSSFAQNVTLPVGPSYSGTMEQTIGFSSIKITYGRPSVTDPRGNDRTGKIWGQLVPYELTRLGFGPNNPAPWRAGANENTVFTISHDAKIEGKDLKAGTYGFHIIVHENNEATLIFSSNAESWGSYHYRENEDVLRVKIKTTEVPQTNLLTYHVYETGQDYAMVALDWEKKRFPFKVAFNVHEVVLNSIRNELRNLQGFGWEGYTSAANYCVVNKVNLEEANTWADAAMGISQNFATLSTKGQVLAAMGKSDESDKYMEQAVNHPTATAEQVYTYGRTLIGNKKADQALELFTKMKKNYPDHWLSTHGLARAYSAKGDFKKALKYEEQAITMAPETSKGFLEGFIKLLKEGKDFN